MGKAVIVIIILALIAFAVFGQYVGVRNTLVTKNEAVKAAWSQVDIVLQRRADLIPNLVNTVKGYAQQEVTVFGDIAKARSALLSAGTPSDKIAANQQLDGRYRPSAGNCRELSSVEIERELFAPAGRVGRHRKSHRGRAQALQRHSPGLQHLRSEIPQQHLRGMGWLQAQRGILRRFRGIAPGSDG